MLPKTIIGVMGPGEGASGDDLRLAEELGGEIARSGWVLLTGGRPEGVMHAASRGARSAGGLTLGILPGDDPGEASEYVDLPICTGMGSARNNINVLTSAVVVACGSGAGTLSEVMLACKAGRPLILLNQTDTVLKAVKEVTGQTPGHCDSPAEAVQMIKHYLDTS